MPDRPFEFDLPDADGVSHHYLVGYHNADEGLDVSLWLLAHSGAIATGLLPALKDAVSSLVSDSSGSVEALLDTDAGKAWGAITGALGSVDMAQVGEQWRNALLAPTAKPVLKSLFRHASRDNLDVGQRFQLVYQANYLEMYQTALKIIKANRFFPWPGTSPSAKG